MGWKNFKEKYSIEHIVHIKDGKLCIGSVYVSDLVIIDMETGKILKDGVGGGGGFLYEYYPLVKSAGNKERLAAIKKGDVFKENLPIFTYNKSEMIEKKTECYGYPNVTHDGCLIYENTFFKTCHKAAIEALEEIKSYISWAKKDLIDLKKQIAKRECDVEEFLKHEKKLVEYNPTKASNGN